MAKLAQICSRFLLFVVATILSISIGSSANATTWFADVPGPYPGNCSGDPTTDHTYWLRHFLSNLGVSGVLNTSHSWASDFIERGYGGQDSSNADAHNIAIFDGHGNTDQLFFAYKDLENRCTAGNADSTGYGSNILLSGATEPYYTYEATTFIAHACCYMNINFTGSIYTFGGTQELGFGGVAHVALDGTMVSQFWGFAQSGYSNSAAWLTAMEDRPGVGNGDNTAVVVTRGWDSGTTNWNRINCNIANGTCWQGTKYGRGPSIYWVRDYTAHGCSGCNGC